MSIQRGAIGGKYGTQLNHSLLKNKVGAQIILQRLHNIKKGYKISQK